MEVAFQCRRHHFIHDNVLPVKLNSAYAILQVCIPYQFIFVQVEDLQISVVISCRDHTLVSIVGVAKLDVPAVWNVVVLHFCGLQGQNRALFSDVPDFDTA